MKQKLSAVLAALLMAAALTACASYPRTDSQGQAWNKEWTILGQVLGVEEPGHGLTLLEKPRTLKGMNTFYASWAIGSPVPYTGADGEETDLYDARLHLLILGCRDEAEARETLAEWTGLLTADETCSREIGPVTYTFLDYRIRSETNPHARGTSAFTVWDSYAVSAELTALDGFEGDTRTILEDFLSGCHYSSE